MPRKTIRRALDIETLEKTYAVVPFVDYELMRRSFDISPDGQRIAFTWNRGGNYQVWTVDVAGGEPHQQTDGDDSASSPLWTRDGLEIIFARDHAGDENYALNRVDPATGAVDALTAAPTASHRSPALSRDGSWLAYLSNEGDGAFNVWVASLDAGAPRKLTHGSFPVLGIDWSPVAASIAFLRMRPGAPPASALAVVDVESGTERTIAHIGGMNSHVHWSPDGTSLLVLDDVAGIEQLVLVDAASGAKRPLATGDWEQTGATFSHDGRTIAYAVNRDGSWALVLHDVSTGEERTLGEAGGIHGGVHFTADDRAVLFIYTGAKSPPDLWSASIDTGAVRRLTNSLPDEVDESSLADARVVRYPSFDCKDVPAMYYPPAGNATAPPAIVYVHGGPTGQHMNVWSPLIQYFTSNGFAVLAPNVRGSTGYGVAWRDAAIRDWGGGDLRDVVAGRDYLAASGLAGERRIAVIGASYGGYMTLMAMTNAPEKWGAGVSIVGIANLRTLYDTTREGDLKPYLVQQIGTPEEDGRFYDERSPLNFVERVQAPLLLLQGANDPRVPLAEAEQMAACLRQAERTFELKVYPDEGHAFMKTANRLDSLRTAMDFLQRHMT